MDFILFCSIMETTLKDFKGRRAIEIQCGARTEATALDQERELMASTRLAGSKLHSEPLDTDSRLPAKFPCSPYTTHAFSSFRSQLK